MVASAGWRSHDRLSVDRCGVGGRVFAEGSANFAYRSLCMRSYGAEQRNLGERSEPHTPCYTLPIGVRSDVTKCRGQNALFLYVPFLLAYVRFLTLVNGSPNPFFFSEPTDSHRASRGCHFLEIPCSVI